MEVAQHQSFLLILLPMDVAYPPREGKALYFPTLWNGAGIPGRAVQNIVVDSNSEHDPHHPFFGNFDLSLACCDPTSGTLYQAPTVTNNVLIQNVATGTLDNSYIGYGIEAWGYQGKYSNNLVQGLNNSIGIAYCYGMLNGTVSNNTVAGPNFAGETTVGGGDGYIGNEGVNNPPPCGVSGTWTPDGYTVNSGTVGIAPGTVTNGAKTDLGINTAPTATTEGSSAICHGTYTNTSSTSPGCVNIPSTGCGTLKPNTPYWVWTITNDTLASSPLYF
jgi:hypothetical protein